MQFGSHFAQERDDFASAARHEHREEQRCLIMKRRLIHAAPVVASLSSTAFGSGTLTPGSLLIYPEFNNAPGALTLLTVTNTSDADTVNVHFAYIDGGTRGETGVTEELTPNDTLTLLTSAHAPGVPEVRPCVLGHRAQPAPANPPALTPYESASRSALRAGSPSAHRD